MTNRSFIFNRLMSMIAMLLLTSFVSCTFVEYEGVIESFDGMENLSMSNVTKVRFDVSLPEDLDESDLPSYMTVLMNRTRTEMCRYVFNLDGQGQFMMEGDSASVCDGFYIISSIAAGDSSDFHIDDLDRFVADDTYKMSDIYVSVPVLSHEEIIQENYIDFNPKHPYVRGVEPMYIVRPDQSSGESIFAYRDSLKENSQEHVIDLTFEKLTRRVTMNLSLGLGEGVEISRVVCVLSGVPVRLQLKNSHVTDSGLGKVAFDMTHVANGVYEGRTDVFGLFSNPTNDQLLVGPGVVNIIVYARTEDNGRVIKRILYKNFNIKSQIDEAEVMEITDDGTAYIFNNTAKEMMFSLGHIFSISQKDLIDGVSQMFEIWQESDEDDNKDVNPGLNPEL